MNKIFAATCASAALVFSYVYFFPAGEALGPAAGTNNIPPSAGAAASSRVVLSSPPSPRSTSLSPFGVGEPPPREDPKARSARLQQKMEKLGFFTPDKYYKLDLKTLRKMAENGDVFATLQLAEQYYSETQGLENDPDYDHDISPKEVANKYLAKAATMGIVRAGTLLSMRYHEEAKPIDAYAWKIISEKFGDKAENVRGYDKVTFPTDPASIKQAQNKADDIIATMLSSPRPVFPQ